MQFSEFFPGLDQTMLLDTLGRKLGANLFAFVQAAQPDPMLIGAVVAAALQKDGPGLVKTGGAVLKALPESQRAKLVDMLAETITSTLEPAKA